MVDYTPTWNLPYPVSSPAGSADSVLPAGRDFKALAEAVAAGLTDVDVRPRLWVKDAVTAGVSLDTITTVGTYPVALTNHPGAPVEAAGYLEVMHATGVRRLQRFTTNEVRPRVFERTGQIELGTWNSWVEMTHHSVFTSAVDFDTIKTPGSYGTAFTSHPGQPIAAGGYLEVLTAGGVRAIQRFTTNNPSPRRFERVAAIEGWNAWVEVGAAPGPGPSGTDTREGWLRLAAMRERVGQVQVTTPAAVCIVMDHGLTNVKSKVVPLMRARGLRATLAINSQRWDDANNSGATQADVRGWADVFELANHGRNHTLNGNTAHDEAEIEGGRVELESQLQVPIDTWIQTGNPEGSYDFNDGRNDAAYWQTNTGQIIARTHAVWTGLVSHPDRLYSMDGQPRPGAHGYWLDTGATMISTAKARVTDAIAQGKRVLLRIHPQFIDQSGYTTTAQLTEFLDWLVARRTNREITVLDFRSWQVADRAQQDTGWRQLPGGTRVRRVGEAVYVQFYGNLPAGTGNVEADTLPVGFRPKWHEGVAYFQGSGLNRCHILTSGTIRFYDVATSAPFVTMGDTFSTVEPWPTTLPGTAA